MADIMKFGIANERESLPTDDFAPGFETYFVDFIECIHQLPNLN